MTTTIKRVVGTRTALPFTSTSLSTLASATYVKNTTAYNCATNAPDDVIIEVDVGTTNTSTGLKQVSVFVTESLDGANFRSGPTTGTTATDEQNLKALGAVPLQSTNSQIGFFSLAATLGFVPNSFFVVIKNETGVALTSGTVFTSEVSTQF